MKKFREVANNLEKIRRVLLIRILKHEKEESIKNFSLGIKFYQFLIDILHDKKK